MRNRMMFLLAVLLGLFAPFARTADSVPAIALAAPAADAKTIPQRGTLYRIRHRGNTAWLFGTIHVGQETFFPLEHEVTRALAEANRLVVELDVRDNGPVVAAVVKHGLYPEGETIEKHLSADSFRQLRQALDKFGISYDAVARMKPWMITNFLIGMDLERNGYQRRHGVEFHLLNQAHALSKPVQELESAEYQLSLFAGMTPDQQERYLLENIGEISDGRAMRKAKVMIDAWSAADDGAFEKLLRDAREEKTASAEFVQRTLLDKRNVEMAAKVEALLRDDKSAFVGVGLLHLIGSNGVPALLRERGYEVQKLY